MMTMRNKKIRGETLEQDVAVVMTVKKIVPKIGKTMTQKVTWGRPKMKTLLFREVALVSEMRRTGKLSSEQPQTLGKRNCHSNPDERCSGGRSSSNKKHRISYRIKEGSPPLAVVPATRVPRARSALYRRSVATSAKVVRDPVSAGMRTRATCNAMAMTTATTLTRCSTRRWLDWGLWNRGWGI